MYGYNINVEETNQDKNDVKFSKNKNASILHFLLIGGVLIGLVLLADKKFKEVL